MLKNGVEILLVEDNSDDAKLAIHAFEKQHLANKVCWVQDGVEALEFLFCTDRYADRNIGNGPKLVLLDLNLPLLDGLEVLRRVKGDPRTHHIPIVVLTTSREDNDVAEAYKLGANSYILKPVDFEQFLKVTEQLGYYWMLLNQPPVVK